LAQLRTTLTRHTHNATQNFYNYNFYLLFLTVIVLLGVPSLSLPMHAQRNATRAFSV
jgi:hypothetical protein